MKTLVLKIRSENSSVQSGILRLTENRSGNFSIEGLSRNLSNKIQAKIFSAIDFCLVGYEDPMNRQQGLTVTIV